MALPKRELGRAGLQVTTLGYGAVELRGVHALAISQKSKRKPFSTRCSTVASITSIPQSIMD